MPYNGWMWKKRIYLDYAAATPVDKGVLLAMKPFFASAYGNPSALYREGVEAKRAVAMARERVASVIHAHPDEIIFTSTGTESIHLAIVGTVEGFLTSTTGIQRASRKPHIITTTIEHAAVLRTVEYLQKKQVIDATYLPVGENGIVDPRAVKSALRPETILVSVMYANNEIGTVQPIREIAKLLRANKRGVGATTYPYFHTDACQAPNYLDVGVNRLGVDMMTLNGAKMYGPKGGAMLYVARGVNILPVMRGGDHEFGKRAGTENVPAVVGFSIALEKADAIREKESMRLRELRDYFMRKLLVLVPGSIVNGDREQRLSNNVHISIPHTDSEQLIVEMDAKGVACAARSACKTRAETPSHVLMALGRAELPGEGAVRFTMGRGTEKKHIDHVLSVLPAIVKKIQTAVMAGEEGARSGAREPFIKRT